jgi:hypothetical protein
LPKEGRGGGGVSSNNFLDVVEEEALKEVLVANLPTLPGMPLLLEN